MSILKKLDLKHKDRRVTEEEDDAIHKIMDRTNKKYFEAKEEYFNSKQGLNKWV